MNSFVSVEEPVTSTGEIDEVVLSTDDNDNESDSKLNLDPLSSDSYDSDSVSDEKTPEVVLHTRFPEKSVPLFSDGNSVNEVDLEKVDNGVYQVSNSCEDLIPVEVNDVDSSVDLMYLPLETVMQNCVDSDIVKLFENSDVESFDGFSDCSDCSFEGFDSVESCEKPRNIESISQLKKRPSFILNTPGLSWPNNNIQNYSKGFASSFYNSAFSNIKKKADGDRCGKSRNLQQEDKENLNQSHFEGFAGEKESEKSIEMDDFIGEHCNKVGCTISWLESEIVKETPVKITNGIVYELSEFAKKIAWKPIYVCLWLLRLLGIRQNEHEVSDEIQRKINAIIKRHRAMSVNYAGKKYVIRTKLASFEAEEVNLLSNQVTQNLRPSPINKEDRNQLKKGSINFENSLENHAFSSHSTSSNTLIEKSNLVSKTGLGQKSYKKCLKSDLDVKKESVDEGTHQKSSNKQAINNKLQENIVEKSEECNKKPASSNNLQQPDFKDDGEEIGFHCRINGIDIKKLNEGKKLNCIITNGILYELYQFFHNRKSSLTSLVHILYQLSGIPFDKSQIISTMVKVNELVRVSWDEEMSKNRNMPFEPFNLQAHDNGKNENEVNLSFKDHLICEPQSKKSRMEHNTKSFSNYDCTSELGEPKSMKKDSTPSADSKVFDLNSTKGMKGTITRGDIVYLYTKWLKRKMEGKDSVFVADLSKDVEELILEREVEFVRIPVGTLMSSSVKLFEEFRTLSKIDMTGAATYLHEDWIEDIKSILNVSQSNVLPLSNSNEEKMINSSSLENSNNDKESETLHESIANKKNISSSCKTPENNSGMNIDEYEVEKIVGYRIVKVGRGKMFEYRIRWSGFTSKDDSWINQKDLNCTMILKEFWAALKKQREKREKLKMDKELEVQKENEDSLVTSDESMNLPFMDSIFLNQMTNNLNANLIDYQHEEVDVSFNKRIKVTKKAVLNIYDRWREENQQRLLIGGNEKLDINIFKSRVKKLMGVKKVRNFNPNCLIDVCFKMSLMKEKLKDPQKIEEYLAGDFMELMQISQKHQEAVQNDNFEKQTMLKQINEKLKHSQVSPISEKISILNNIEREANIISNKIEREDTDEKSLNQEINALKTILEPQLEKGNMKKLSRGVVRELESLGVKESILGDLVNIASNIK